MPAVPNYLSRVTGFKQRKGKSVLVRGNIMSLSTY